MTSDRTVSRLDVPPCHSVTPQWLSGTVSRTSGPQKVGPDHFSLFGSKTRCRPWVPKVLTSLFPKTPPPPPHEVTYRRPRFAPVCDQDTEPVRWTKETQSQRGGHLRLYNLRWSIPKELSFTQLYMWYESGHLNILHESQTVYVFINN